MAKVVKLPEKTPVPANWIWVELGKLSSTKSGYPFDSKRFSGDKKGKRPIIRIRDVVRGYTETYTDEDCPEVFIINKGEILIGMDGDFNLAKWNDSEALLNQRVCCIQSTSELLLNDFVYFYLPIPLKLINEATPSITVKHLSTKTISQIPFPLPPLPEQHRIVTRIESLFAKLDEAKEKAQAVVDGFELRKSAILHKAFTGELTERWRKEHGVGLDSWEKRTIQSVCAMKITDGTHKTPTYCDAGEGVPYISAKDVTSGRIDWNNIKHIVPELHEELYQRLAPQVDDVLLAKNGTTGVAAIVEEEKIFDIYVTLAVLRPDKSVILPRYLLNIVNSPICKNQFDEHLTGIGVPNLHLRDIKEVLLNVPSFEEQTEVIRIIDNIAEKEQQAKEAAENVLAQIDTMKKAILVRAFRGELGTNDPEEEWAGELVKTYLPEQMG